MQNTRDIGQACHLRLTGNNRKSINKKGLKVT